RSAGKLSSQTEFSTARSGRWEISLETTRGPEPVTETGPSSPNSCLWEIRARRSLAPPFMEQRCDAAADSARRGPASFYFANQFPAQFRRHRPVVAGRIEQKPDHIPKIGVGNRFKTFGHQREFAGANARSAVDDGDIASRDDVFGGAGGEKLQSGGCVLNNTPIEHAPVLQLDFGVLEAVPDDFVRVNDIVEQGV